MTRLELTSEEATVLIGLLEHDVAELGYEIADTDSADYRNGLKRRRAAARSILEQLQDETARAS